MAKMVTGTLAANESTAWLTVHRHFEFHVSGSWSGTVKLEAKVTDEDGNIVSEDWWSTTSNPAELQVGYAAMKDTQVRLTAAAGLTGSVVARIGRE